MSLGPRLSAACVFAIAMLALPARAELVAALSNHLVAITTGFSGTDVLLFGATDGTGEVQTEERSETLPDGASGWMSLVVTVDPDPSPT